MTVDEFRTLLPFGESDDLDWKAEVPPGIVQGKKGADWNRGRATILKDIVSIANGEGNQFGFLVYGVKDKRSSREIVGVNAMPPDADLQTWAEQVFEPSPKFTSFELHADCGKRVAIIRIERVPSYPHVVKHDFGDVLCAGQIWFRRGSKNTVASSADIRRMIQGAEPFKMARSSNSVMDQIVAHYRSQNRECYLPALADKDPLLTQGYDIAYYPGSRREVWVGEINGRFEHILMLRPAKSA